MAGMGRGSPREDPHLSAKNGSRWGAPHPDTVDHGKLLRNRHVLGIMDVKFSQL
jgi:hypothetical protein